MINRALIRTKTVQLMYSWQSNPQPDTEQALKQQQLSIQKTFELYHWLLLLSIEITKYAIKRIEIGMNKLRPTAEESNPNKRFINNKLYKQLLGNIVLNDFAKENGIGWTDDDEDFIKEMYGIVINSDIYKEYMAAPEVTYEDEKMLWRKLYRKVLAQSPALENYLEDMDLYWNDDIETVLSFIEKTIKHFTPESDDTELLLPMYRDETDRDFAEDLIKKAVEHQDEYRQMVVETAKNWEQDRIATMDMVIMIVAIAEIVNFPAIPLNVSINEYLEIAKVYSTEKSKTFINGVLDAIAEKLKKSGKLLKVAIVKAN